MMSESRFRNCDREAELILWWSSRTYIGVQINFPVKPNFSLVRLGCIDVGLSWVVTKEKYLFFIFSENNENLCY